MTLIDVLPQIEQLDRDDLIELQFAVSQLLHNQERNLGQDEVRIVNERYRDYLDNPEDFVSADEMADYLDDLIRQ
jgi:hypothetical protein